MSVAMVTGTSCDPSHGVCDEACHVASIETPGLAHCVLTHGQGTIHRHLLPAASVGMLPEC